MAKNVVTLNLDGADYSFRPYGICSTSAVEIAKKVSIPEFTLCNGATVLVKFTLVNTAPNPTLNVNNTGDIPIKAINGWSMITDPNIYYEFLYDGANWNLIGEEKRRCKLSSGNTNNYPWRRIAYTDILTSTWQRRTTILILNQAVYNGKYGELVIKVSSNGANTASSYEAYWLVNKGFSTGSIKIGVNNTFGKTYFDVFYKCPGTWQNLLIDEKTGGYDNSFHTSFTLCNSIEPSDTTTTNKLTSIESYASIEDAATELHNIAYTAIVEPNCTSGTSIDEILFNGKSTNSDKLGGQLPDYYATKEEQNNLANQLQAISAGLKVVASISPSVIYKNTATNVTISGTVKNNSGNVTASEIVIKSESTTLKSATNTTSTSITKSVTTGSSENTISYIITATASGLPLSTTINLNARHPVYYGMGKSVEDVKANGIKASARTTAVSNTTYDATAGANGVRFYLLVPSDVTRPTSFSMGGAPVDMVLQPSTTTINGIVYYIFYTNAIYNYGASVQIKAQ